jgi:CheY-like chemotaxis protein
VFDLFAQGSRTADRAQGGLGLGLALVRSLVELHGGSAEAHSAGPGQGSTFRVRLPRISPAALEARPAAERSQAQAQPADPLRLLVVDDNADVAHTLQLYLEAAGHEVRVAADAPAALALARAFAPQACLLDIGLPGIDGNELARRLRALPQAAGATLIAMTGYGRQQDRDRSMAAGFDHYLVKPVDTAQLAALLAQVEAA